MIIQFWTIYRSLNFDTIKRNQTISIDSSWYTSRWYQSKQILTYPTPKSWIQNSLFLMRKIGSENKRMVDIGCKRGEGWRNTSNSSCISHIYSVRLTKMKIILGVDAASLYHSLQQDRKIPILHKTRFTMQIFYSLISPYISESYILESFIKNRLYTAEEMYIHNIYNFFHLIPT